MDTIRSVVTGTGHYLPENIVPNSYFEEYIDTSDEWITARTGIKRRHYASIEETTSTMGIKAARKALKNSGCKPEDIDLIILATSTSDHTFPSTATQIQNGLGITRGYAFDLQAVCAGFVFALANANALIKSGEATKALVIGSETFSRILDKNDRTTCILFGDGAGAVVLEGAKTTNGGSDRGILATDLHSDGSFKDILYVDGGVSTTKTSGHLRMKGKEVFRHAVSKLVNSTERVMEKANVTSAEVDWAVPHQANVRIIQSTTQKLKIPIEKVIVTLQNHGNTSAASIPISLSVANEESKFKKGDLILSHAIGGGLCWGSFLLRW